MPSWRSACAHGPPAARRPPTGLVQGSELGLACTNVIDDLVERVDLDLDLGVQAFETGLRLVDLLTQVIEFWLGTGGRAKSWQQPYCE